MAARKPTDHDMGNTRLFLRSLLIPLFATSVYVLWIRDSGFFQHISKAINTGHQIDGEPVRTHYTGITKLDDLLTIFVTFYYPLVSKAGQDMFGDWLVGDMLPTTILFTVACLAEGYRERQGNGYRRWWIALPGLWMLSYQLFGTSVIMPLFAFLHLGGSPASTAKLATPVSSRIAAGLIPAAFIGGFAPMLATILPLGLDSNVMQKVIAGCQLYPLLIAVILAMFYYQPGDKSKKGVLTNSYLFLAFIATVVRIVTLFRLQQTGEFFKWAKQLWWLDFSETATPVGATALFLKYDALITGIAGIIWVGILASDAGVKDVWAMLAICGVVGGPGAAMGAGLFMREGRIAGLAKAEERRKLRDSDQAGYGTATPAVPAGDVRAE
ncbi:hypothetical protein BJ508DRAFT_321320 [Ascobolus immersus RN42]|uniref:Uncharacterized protein n=1 Tax=Ascobolus immersus RN42 TaxID=1160509 RepID=A0A3N4IKS6_ASCIM|nr:hypothetical protein BJ508DRAFT_321320 [Ascobolus immersus RN42]